MANSNTFRPGKHFLQIPGPTNVPDRVLRAMDYPTIDHRGPDFAEIGLRVLDKIKLIFKILKKILYTSPPHPTIPTTTNTHYHVHVSIIGGLRPQKGKT